MNDYEAKLEAKRERLRQAAKKADARADAAWKQMDSIACVIPLGQPILVGHHSEKRHRRDLKKMDRSMRKSVEERKLSAELERRADAIGTAGISSDDPEAITKLKTKLSGLERERDAIKAHNASARKAGASDRLVPGWKLTNLGATIRATKQRIEQIEKETARRATTPDPIVQTFGDVTVTEHSELNRIAIKFPSKPDASVLARLRSEGWHFNRRGDLAMCWTRMLNNAARNSARYVLMLEPSTAPGVGVAALERAIIDVSVAEALRHRIGAQVTVDGGYKAIIRDVFPEGSTSYLFPHYKVDFLDGDKGVAIALHRVHIPEGREEYLEIDGIRFRACVCETPSPRFSAAELAGELPDQGEPPPSQYCDACFRPVRSST